MKIQFDNNALLNTIRTYKKETKNELSLLNTLIKDYIEYLKVNADYETLEKRWKIILNKKDKPIKINIADEIEDDGEETYLNKLYVPNIAINFDKYIAGGIEQNKQINITLIKGMYVDYLEKMKIQLSLIPNAAINNKTKQIDETLNNTNNLDLKMSDISDMEFLK